MAIRPPAAQRADTDLHRLENRVRRAGFGSIAGADEAGRGACAGPLVVGACVLPTGRRGVVPELADSKLLTPQTRDRVYEAVVARAVAWSVVVIPAAEIDRIGLHVANVAGMRRALARLDPPPTFCLTDGFPVRGLGRPALAVWKGDRVAASVAAASVLAKVTRDRMLVELDERFPGYGFAEHKGYVTPAHTEALARLGPCPEHRRSYVNVRRAAALGGALLADGAVAELEADDAVAAGLIAGAAVRDDGRGGREVA